MNHLTPATIDSMVNKSFLVLDEIHESLFPLLEKSILSTSTPDKTKVSKIEYIIQQRIKHVEHNCNQLESILSDKSPTTTTSDKSHIDLIYRLKQLKSEQKRILSAFKGIKHKRVERERVEREQEELLTRRFTTNNEYDSNANSENIVIDLKHDDFSKDALKSLNKSTILTMNKIRNQRPLVKRVRTRYLNFSADFLGFTKLVFKYSCVDFLILFACSMIILLVIFCFIIWQTSTTRQFN